ncbi:MAG: hypothetical protein OEX81_05860 [Candidatus Pacebacteria bacterium]|nr:hypothetical protein [Candidatus Paceibacterota bacterium]
MNYSKKRAMAQIAAFSLKSKIVAPGTSLKLVDIQTGSFEQNGNEVANDVMLCETKDGNLRVPVREFLKMKNSDGTPVFKSEEGSDEVSFPNNFKIVSSKPRTDRDGNAIYPTYAYKKVDDFFDGAIDWNGLVDGGLKKDHGFDQVQDYTISID